jgi:hypothetical protein
VELLAQPGVVKTFVPATAWSLLATAAGVVWSAALPTVWLAATAFGAGLVGAAEALRAVVELSRRRRLADDWLRSSTGRVVPDRYAWRARQLLAACERLRLAETLRRIERRSGERPLQGAMRLTAVSENREGLQLLASTLERVDQPVTPAGVLRVIDLITDGTGPLWNAPRGAVLEETISSTLDVLQLRADDPRGHAHAA